jgi:hypothetical protein
VRRLVRGWLAVLLLAGAVLVGWPDSAQTPIGVTATPGELRDARPLTVRVERGARRPRVLPRPWRVRAARRWAARRAGRVAWAAIDTRGRLVGSNRAWSFPSASLSKAMLLVAELRRTARAGRRLDPGTRAVLAAMIRVSDNDAADAIYRRAGDGGLLEVARVARMRRFGPAGWWSEARVTAADQARFFLRIDRLVARARRSYLRRLLAGVVASQSWGIPRALRPRGWSVFFKGGW